MDTRQRWNDDEPLPEGAFNDGPEYGNPLNLAILGLPPLRRYEEEESHIITMENGSTITSGGVQVWKTTIHGVIIWDASDLLLPSFFQFLAKRNREKRWQSIRKRQRRAAQRRHNKGNAARRK